MNKAEATKAAKALSKLLGRGFEPHTWENFGWHYSSRKGLIEIMPTSDTFHNYIAYLDTVPQITSSDKTAVGAYNGAISRLNIVIESLNRAKIELES